MSTEDTTPALAIGVCIAALSVGLLIQLGIGLLHAKFPAIPLPTEGLLWLLLGVFISVLLDAEKLPSSVHSVVTLLDDSFAPFFFQALLPPIIFRSGWALAVGLDGLSLKDFFGFLQPALVLAFLGTLTATLVTAVWQFIFAAAGATYGFSWLQCVILAVSLSATDTVCVLSMLRELQVKSSLYATIYAESLFNDAVVIVLFRSIVLFTGDRPAAGAGGTGMVLLWSVLDFLWGFVGSSLIGCAIGVSVALVFKHGGLGRLGESGLDVERALLAMTPFLSFMAAEASGASGVVSALFCGVLVAAIAQRNVASSSAAFAGQLYLTAGTLAEHLTFIFLGVACTEMSGPAMARHWPAAVVLLIGCALGRAAAVGVSVAVINRTTKSQEQKITAPMAVVIWGSGLRGGVAFALASAAAAGFADREAAAAFPVAAIFVAAVTLPVISFCTGPLIRHLGLQAKDGQAEPTYALGPAGHHPSGSELPHVELSGLAAEGTTTPASAVGFVASEQQQQRHAWATALISRAMSRAYEVLVVEGGGNTPSAGLSLAAIPGLGGMSAGHNARTSYHEEDGGSAGPGQVGGTWMPASGSRSGDVITGHASGSQGPRAAAVGHGGGHTAEVEATQAGGSFEGSSAYDVYKHAGRRGSRPSVEAIPAAGPLTGHVNRHDSRHTAGHLTGHTQLDVATDRQRRASREALLLQHGATAADGSSGGDVSRGTS